MSHRLRTVREERFFNCSTRKTQRHEARLGAKMKPAKLVYQPIRKGGKAAVFLAMDVLRCGAWPAICFDSFPPRPRWTELNHLRGRNRHGCRR